MFHVPEALAFWKAAGAKGVRLNPPSGTRLRAVTHLDVAPADVADALDRIASCLRR